MPRYGFRRRYIRDIPRIGRIIGVASRHGFGQLVEQLGLQRFFSLSKRVTSFEKPRSSEHRIGMPERLRLMFEDLGPTFIKFGQVLACRPDMLPIEYSREFLKLTDSVAPFPSDEATKIIEEDLKAAISTLFASFDRVPVAAASIAQVHQATLRDGSPVIVKVQRPHIVRTIERDISVMHWLAELIEAQFPETAPYDLPGIIDEFARTIKRELDFFIEASNATQLRKNFSNSSVLYVPQVYTDLSSKRVIVLEKIEGIRIDEYDRLDREGYDRKEIARKGGAAYFKMVLQDGFFHADPHPGNIFVLPDGRLGLVDFGIMGRVTEENMEHFASVFLALSNHDYDALVRQYVELGFVSETAVDIEQFQREMKQDLVELLEPYSVMQVKQIDFGAYLDHVTHILLRHRLKLPSNLYLMDKSLITLEGILKQLDPEFNYFEAATPYVADLIRRRRNPLRAAQNMQKNISEFVDAMTLLPRQIKATFRKVTRGEIRISIHHEELQNLIRDIDKSSNRLAFSVITAAIIVASSIIIHSAKGPVLFGLPIFGLIGYVIAALLGFWILIGILRSGQL
ncbi:MAG TPA: AarF/ABC1/UbiB kinase family protein [Nitrospirota bacterium]|nr:AarF/ABC1/UbiB kinase family protein [Nitrospirota bacterium]